ncbi:7337_t:CDS:2 [Rhizophagus irregularis]|nr:7337_t:CDS:2 [Rhizophagus irregularis]
MFADQDHMSSYRNSSEKETPDRHRAVYPPKTSRRELLAARIHNNQQSIIDPIPISETSTGSRPSTKNNVHSRRYYGLIHMPLVMSPLPVCDPNVTKQHSTTHESIKNDSETVHYTVIIRSPNILKFMAITMYKMLHLYETNGEIIAPETNKSYIKQVVEHGSNISAKSTLSSPLNGLNKTLQKMREHELTRYTDVLECDSQSIPTFHANEGFSERKLCVYQSYERRRDKNNNQEYNSEKYTSGSLLAVKNLINELLRIQLPSLSPIKTVFYNKHKKDNLTTAKAFESVTTGQVHFSGYSKQRTRVLLQHRSVMDSKPSERGGVGTKYRRGFCVIVKSSFCLYPNVLSCCHAPPISSETAKGEHIASQCPERLALVLDLPSEVNLGFYLKDRMYTKTNLHDFSRNEANHEGHFLKPLRGSSRNLGF